MEGAVLGEGASQILNIIVAQFLVFLTSVVERLDLSARLLLRHESLTKVGQISHEATYQAWHLIAWNAVNYLKFYLALQQIVYLS